MTELKIPKRFRFVIRMTTEEGSQVTFSTDRKMDPLVEEALRRITTDAMLAAIKAKGGSV